MKVPEETRNSVNVETIIKENTEDKSANWEAQLFENGHSTIHQWKKINKCLFHLFTKFLLFETCLKLQVKGGRVVKVLRIQTVLCPKSLNDSTTVENL